MKIEVMVEAILVIDVPKARRLTDKVMREAERLAHEKLEKVDFDMVDIEALGSAS